MLRICDEQDQEVIVLTEAGREREKNQTDKMTSDRSCEEISGVR